MSSDIHFDLVISYWADWQWLWKREEGEVAQWAWDSGDFFLKSLNYYVFSEDQIDHHFLVEGELSVNWMLQLISWLRQHD